VEAAISNGTENILNLMAGTSKRLIYRLDQERHA
jgi:hypothetical protein